MQRREGGIASSWTSQALLPPPALPAAQRPGVATLECSLLGLALHIAAPHALMPALGVALSRWSATPCSAAAWINVHLAFDTALIGTDSVAITARDHVLLLEGAGAIGVADAWQGSAQASLSTDYLEAGDALREQVIEPLVLFLGGHAGRTPLHAAGIVAGGIAILLAGPSGSGKSCLALAAQDAGLAVLSDDTVYLQRLPELAVWGAPQSIHVFAADAGAHVGPVRLRNGKSKLGIAHRTPVTGPFPHIAWCRLAHGDAPLLRRTGRREALAGFANPEPGFDLFAADIRRAGELLVTDGGWELTLGRDPAAAIDVLLGQIEALRASAAA